MDMRVGIGHDSHRLTIGSHLNLGGITIPHDRTTIAHSDGDVLLHAVTDAILGALAQGDIGEHFPDTEPAEAGRSSREMLLAVWKRATDQGWRLVNLDCTVILERPRLGPLKAEIREQLAALLGAKPEQISVKAKTAEGVGPVGREEAVEAHCVVLLRKGTDVCDC
ncbi:MAG: 2-C-methyl-D-erythritol 2,4-cyclodiphosphate synthase [Thermoguttaceae bacterium]|nr:2-C-methyl-D-erythritol 2,4-cyclodiphosphate synthase [Thermoguttaceae bacterium]MDW8079828.1 2-C-methyl-D-erythritol 2,4-cyclodiphosphate synthase [Thermoguttaceae bacterium]